MNPMFYNGLWCILLFFFPLQIYFCPWYICRSHNQVTSHIREISESSGLNPTFLSALKFLTFYLHRVYKFDHVALQTNCITNFLSYPTNIVFMVQFIWTNMKYIYSREYCCHKQIADIGRQTSGLCERCREIAGKFCKCEVQGLCIESFIGKMHWIWYGRLLLASLKIIHNEC